MMVPADGDLILFYMQGQLSMQSIQEREGVALS